MNHIRTDQPLTNTQSDLCAQNVDLVSRLMYRSKHFRVGLHNELLSAGYDALVRAAQLWVEDGPTSFRTFAQRWIRGGFAALIHSRREKVVDLTETIRLYQTDSGKPEFSPWQLQVIDVILDAAGMVLTEREAEVFELRYLDAIDWTLEEIAEKLGVTKQAIYNRAGAAITKIRNHLISLRDNGHV